MKKLLDTFKPKVFCPLYRNIVWAPLDCKNTPMRSFVDPINNRDLYYCAGCFHFYNNKLQVTSVSDFKKFYEMHLADDFT